MAFTISQLTDYIKTEPKVDIMPIVLNTGSVEAGVSVQEGIKSASKLIYTEGGEVIIQAGDYTASSASGDFELKDKDITVVERHIKELYKPQALQAKVAQLAMSAGSDIEDLPKFVKDALIETKVKNITKKNEQSLWLGDSSLTGSAANVRHLEDFSGWIKLAQDATNTTKATLGIALTAANAEAVVSAVTVLLPEELIDQPTTLFMSMSNFQIFRGVMMAKYVQTQVFDAKIGVSFEYQIPGTEITAKGMTGLNGSNAMLLAMPANLYMGVDLKGEDEDAELRKLENRAFELFTLYKLGAQIGIEGEIVVTAGA